jgi:hypothetical protein
MPQITQLTPQHFVRSEGGRIEGFSGNADEARGALQEIAQLTLRGQQPREGYLKIRASGDGLSLGTRWLKSNNDSVNQATDIVRSLVRKAYGDRPGVAEALDTYLAGTGGRVGTRSLLKLLSKVDPGALPQVNAGQLRSSIDGAALERSNQLADLSRRVQAFKGSMQAADAAGLEGRIPTDIRRVFEVGNLLALRAELKHIEGPLNRSQSSMQRDLIEDLERVLDERLQTLPTSLSLQCAALANRTAAGALSAEAGEAALAELSRALGGMVSALNADPDLQGLAHRFLAGHAGSRLAMSLRAGIAAGDQRFAAPLLATLDALRAQYLAPGAPDPKAIRIAGQIPMDAQAKVTELLANCDEAIKNGSADAGAVLVGAMRGIGQIAWDHLPAGIERSADNLTAAQEATIAQGLRGISQDAAMRLSSAVSESAMPLIVEIDRYARDLLKSMDGTNRKAGLGATPTASLHNCITFANNLEAALQLFEGQLRARALGVSDAATVLRAEPTVAQAAASPVDVATLDKAFPALSIATLEARAGPARHPQFDGARLDETHRADALHCRDLAELLAASDLDAPSKARLARTLSEAPFAGIGRTGLEAAVRLATQRGAEIEAREQQLGVGLSPAALRDLLIEPALASRADGIGAMSQRVLQAVETLGDPSIEIGPDEIRGAQELLRQAEPLALSLLVARLSTAAAGGAPDARLEALDREIRQLETSLGDLLFAIQEALPDLLKVQDLDPGPEAGAADAAREAILAVLEPERKAGDAPPLTESLQMGLLQRAALFFSAAGHEEGVAQAQTALAELDPTIRTESISDETILAARQARGSMSSDSSLLEPSLQDYQVQASERPESAFSALRGSQPNQRQVSESAVDSMLEQSVEGQPMRQPELVQLSEASSIARPASLSEALIRDLRAVGLDDDMAALRAFSARAEELAEGDPDEVTEYFEQKAASHATHLQGLGLAGSADDLDLRMIGRLLADFAETLEDVYAGRPLDFNQYLSVAVMLR